MRKDIGYGFICFSACLRIDRELVDSSQRALEHRERIVRRFATGMIGIHIEIAVEEEVFYRGGSRYLRLQPLRLEHHDGGDREQQKQRGDSGRDTRTMAPDELA